MKKTTKQAAKQASAKKAPAKKAPATKAPAKKGPAKKAAAKKGPATKAPAKKAPAKKAAAKKAPATKAPAKKAAPGGAATRKAATSKTATSKTATRKAAPAKAAKGPAAKGRRTAPASKVAGKAVTGKAPEARLVVRAEEEPWTREELAEVKAQLTADVTRLTDELHIAEEDLAGLMRSSGEGAGNDQADVGAASFERDQELTIANNARDMLMQSQHALRRIADGTYGVCEVCGEPIGKNRLMVFPRATMCLSCKQREERR
ncbi:MAG TPA: TraR/DksA C4-type zinc finger protein [Marmoricola sp.]|nr:TraR/DksA C4-type zinc finger protein [Marmoricola sp.]